MPAAFPFIEVDIDLSGIPAVSERAPGVIAVVGESDEGEAAAETVVQVGGVADVDKQFGLKTKLGQSLKLAFRQSPRPTTVYGVKAKSNGNPPTVAAYKNALAALEAADDVTFVSLANEPVNPSANSSASAVSRLVPLKQHCETMSDEGLKRIAVVMVNPPDKTTDADKIARSCANLKSGSSRMVVVAGRGAVFEEGEGEEVVEVDADVATASMAAFAGFPPHVSMVLKKVRGFRMPVEAQYSPTEIKELSEGEIIPIIDPALVPGEGLHFAEGQTFTSEEKLLYLDIVRVLDHIEFELKAGLIGTIGDARITKPGLSAVKARTEGILAPLQRGAMIDGFDVRIPVLDALFLPEAARTPADRSEIVEAREKRQVQMTVSITYGPAVHRLLVTLAPSF